MCNYCKRRGHQEHECRKKARQGTANAGEANAAIRYGESKPSPTLQNTPHYGWMATGATTKIETETCYTATPPLLSWVCDSGCTSHLVSSPEGVLNFKTCDSIETIKQAGKDATPMRVIGHGVIQPFGRVQVVPEVGRNLLSVTQLWREKKWRHTADDFVEFIDTLNNDKLVVSGYLHACGLHIIDKIHWDNVAEKDGEAALAAEATKATLAEPSRRLLEAHFKFGHLSQQGLAELHRHELLPGITTTDLRAGFGTCAACISAKLTRKPRSKKSREPNRATRRFEFVQLDYCGPMSVDTVDGHRGFMCFWDEYDRQGYAYLVKHKGEATEVLQRFETEELVPRGARLGTLRTDGGGEFTSAAFSDYCRDKGIKRELTARYSPHQNPLAERGNRTLVDMATAQLHHCGLGKEWWGPSILHAMYTRNRCPTMGLNGGIPYVKGEGKLPDYNMLIPFGVPAHVLVPDTMRTKFDSKSVQGIFIGVSRGRKAHMIYLPKRKIIVHSRNVEFELDAAGTRDFYQPKLEGSSNERYTGSGYMPVTSKPAVNTGNASDGGTTAEQAPIPPTNKLTVDNVGKLNVHQLKAELRKHSSKTSGNKLALQQRLRNAMRAPAHNPAATATSTATDTPIVADVPASPAETKEEGTWDTKERATQEAYLTEFIESQLFYQGYAFLTGGEREIDDDDGLDRDDGDHGDDSRDCGDRDDDNDNGSELNPVASNEHVQASDTPILAARAPRILAASNAPC